VEKYAAKNVRGKARDEDVFQMIWGCFTGNKLGPVVFLNGIVNSDLYIDILQNNLLPYLDMLTNEGISDWRILRMRAKPQSEPNSRFKSSPLCFQ